MSRQKLARRICSNGFIGFPGVPRQPVREQEVEIAVEYLQRFGESKRLTRFAPGTGDIKRAAELWAGKYLSNGALLTAALRLGFKVKQYPGTPHAQIGVYRRDVAKLSVPRPQAQIIPFPTRTAPLRVV